MAQEGALDATANHHVACKQLGSATRPRGSTAIPAHVYGPQVTRIDASFCLHDRCSSTTSCKNAWTMSTSAIPRPAPGTAQSLARCESLKVRYQTFWAQPLPVRTTQRAGARPAHGRIPLSSVSSERRSSSTTALLQAAAPQTGQMNSRCTKFNSAPARLLSPEAASLQSDFLRGLRRIISTLSPTRSPFLTAAHRVCHP